MRVSGCAFGLALVVLGLLVGCEGIGRPIVGRTPIVDGGDGHRCEVTPACRAVRSVDPEAFVVPEARRQPGVALDCDGDLVMDVDDNCPGVPNATQLDGDCDGARDACRRLADGEAALDGADLRGCRLDAPVSLEGRLSLRGADLSCAHITWVGGSEPGTVDLRGATLAGAAIDVTTDAPVTVDTSETTLRDGFLRIAGAARLRADGAIFDGASLVVEPASDALGDGAPAVSIARSSVQGTTLFEGPSVRAGRVRVDASTVRDSLIDAVAFEAIDVTFLGATLDASELVVLGGEMTSTQIRASDAALSALTMTDVIFAECGALRVFAGQLENVDAPTCPPDGLRIEASEVTDSRFGGGLAMIGGRLAVSVVGDGPTSTIHTDGAVLDAVTLCDPGAGAFHAGELRCVKCDEHAFMEGAAVCLSETRIFERGCPAIELAPTCP